MPALNYIVASILLVAAAAMVVAQYVAYYRRVRPPAFGAFLETAGWLILLLGALGVFAGGLVAPGTLRVEIVSFAVGLACVAAGQVLMRRGKVG